MSVVFSPDKIQAIGFKNDKVKRLNMDRHASVGLEVITLHAKTLYPIADLDIRVYATAAATTGKPEARTLVGEGKTNSKGRSEVEFLTSETVRRRISVLDRQNGRLAIEVAHPDGKTLLESSVKLELQPQSILLKVPLPIEKVTLDSWKKVGERALEARISQMHELAAQLMKASEPPGLFIDFTIDQRHSILAELDTACLDPEGRLPTTRAPLHFAQLRSDSGVVATGMQLGRRIEEKHVAEAFGGVVARREVFQDLTSVDWAFNEDELKLVAKGKPGAAFASAAGRYTASTDAFGPAVTAPITKDKRLIQYRDYLRNIFTGAPGTQGYPQGLQALEQRFHQKFSTQNTTFRCANELLITIVKDILTAEAGQGYGFGIDAATIEPRGDRSWCDYLHYLIELSGVAKTEFCRRYRLDLSREDVARSSLVGENIATLVGFYADGFQSVEDPFPIIPAALHGRPPFFLHYDEWCSLKGPFFGENFYQLLDTAFAFGMHQETEERLRETPDPTHGWLTPFFLAKQSLLDGHEMYTLGEYSLARDLYAKAKSHGLSALTEILGSSSQSPIGLSTAAVQATAARWQMFRDLPLANADDLEFFLEKFKNYNYYGQFDKQYNDLYVWVNNSKDRLQFDLVRMLTFVLPMLRGDLELAAGNMVSAIREYEQTTRFLVASARQTDPEGYVEGKTVFKAPFGKLYHKDGPLPYSTPCFSQKDEVLSWEQHHNDAVAYMAASLFPEMLHPVERRLCRLRHGEALLQWADSLYRTEEPGNIARARELYKATLLLNGLGASISPNWSTSHFSVLSKLNLPAIFNHNENPALSAQKTRARQGLFKIAAGLNFHGLNDAMIPALRYRPLKGLAYQMAGSAKSAQQEFLLYVSKIEDGIKDGILTANLLKKAEIQGRIAEEQIAIAQHQVDLAAIQVQKVQQQIEAKRNEIEESETFWNELVGFIGGMVTSVTDLWGKIPENGQGAISGGLSSAAGLSTSTGVSGAAAGAGVLGGYALFLYSGCTSLNSVEEARSSLRGELRILRDEVLPMAEAELRVRQREVTIAGLQGELAEADAELARSLIYFQSARFLNTELWSQLAAVMKRVLQRYLALGARYAWLAERALAFEQNRSLDIVRIDYYPQSLQGLTGADLLEADLSTLEAARLDGLRSAVPIRRIVSLAFDFPLAFARLKRTGACSFFTTETMLSSGYPGFYGFRNKAVSIHLIGAGISSPLRGALRHSGLSRVSDKNGELKTLVTGIQALPISDFDFDKHREIHDLPGETLMAFEGTGFESFWQVEFPTAANLQGLGALIDLQVVFDVRAYFSEKLYAKQAAGLTKSNPEMVFLSARVLYPDNFGLLGRDAKSVRFEFNLASARIAGAGRLINNLVVMAPGLQDSPLSLSVSHADKTATIILAKGLALSNAPPFSDAQVPVSPMPLNAITGGLAEQPIVVTILKAENPSINFFNLKDLVLGIEYR